MLGLDLQHGRQQKKHSVMQHRVHLEQPDILIGVPYRAMAEGFGLTRPSSSSTSGSSVFAVKNDYAASILYVNADKGLAIRPNITYRAKARPTT